MTKPVRLRLSRAKGFNLQALSLETNGLEAVNVARGPGRIFGNPFDFRASAYCWIAVGLGCRGDPAGRQEASVKAFREWVDPPDGRRVDSFELVARLGEVAISPMARAGTAPAHDEIRKALTGRNLACWCKPAASCHADVLLEIANRPMPAITCDEIAGRKAAP